jgi:very-short-patch-repair endonuclease
LHCSALPGDEVATHDGIPVTTVPRTLFDLAGVVRPADLRRAVNEAEVRRLWDGLSLGDLLTRHRRRPGAAAIRDVIGLRAGITREGLEDAFADFLRRMRLPPSEANLWLLVGGRWIEVDRVWREQRLIVELDGRSTHDTSLAFERDRARDRALIAAGWRVIRVTWHQLRAEPAALARDLRAALGCAPAPSPALRRRL